MYYVHDKRNKKVKLGPYTEEDAQQLTGTLNNYVRAAGCYDDPFVCEKGSSHRERFYLTYLLLEQFSAEADPAWEDFGSDYSDLDYEDQWRSEIKDPPIPSYRW